MDFKPLVRKEQGTARRARAGGRGPLEVALAAVQDGNTVTAEALCGRFIDAFAERSPWVTAGDRGNRG